MDGGVLDAGSGVYFANAGEWTTLDDDHQALLVNGGGNRVAVGVMNCPECKFDFRSIGDKPPRAFS